MEVEPTFTNNQEEVMFDNHQDYQERERNRRIVDGWRQLDKHYQETRVYEESKRILEERGCVTIIGPPGDGKTATLRHLALHMEAEGYDIILIKDAKTLEKYCAHERKQLMVLDDPIGKMIVDIKKFEEFFSISEEVQNAINDRQMKVVLSVWNSTFGNCRSDIRRSYMGKNLVDTASDDLQLNAEERQQILKKYSMPQTKQQVKSSMEEKFPGFPLLCHILSEDPEGVLSDSPNVKEVLFTQVQNMERHDLYRYCALVLLAMADGELDPDNLLLMSEDNTKNWILQQIIESCGLSPNSETFKQLKESLCAMKNRYLIESDGVFAFLHNTIYDVVVEHYGAKNLSIIIKFASSSFIKERVRVDNVERTSGLVQIPTNKYRDLAVRIIKDINGGQAYNVFNNPSVANKEFQIVLAQELAASSDRLKALVTPMQEESTKMKQMQCSLDAALLSSSPIHWICRLGCTVLLKYILEAFSESPEIILKSLEGHASPLHFAAGNGHLETVEYLLSLNVDPNAKSMPKKVDPSVGEYHIGFTPLFYAARENHLDVVKCLLINGADPDTVRNHSASLVM